MYRFPRTIFVEQNTLDVQSQHIISELVEVLRAMNYETPARVAEELVDLIHSAESALRILQEQHHINISVVASEVISKNQRRKYYV